MIAHISKLLDEIAENLKAYTEFSTNSVRMTAKELQHPSFTRKCGGVVRFSGIQALQYVSSSSYNNTDDKSRIMDNSLSSLPMCKVGVVGIHVQVAYQNPPFVIFAIYHCILRILFFVLRLLRTQLL